MVWSRYMQTKINCASDGRHPNGAACPYFDNSKLACVWEGPCIYQLHSAIDAENVQESERVPQPTTIAHHLKTLETGASRIRELWGAEVFQSLITALDIIDKYHPGRPKFHQGYLDDPETMQRDIVYLTALLTTISVAQAQAEASKQTLDLWRHHLRADKYQAIRDNYMAGIRRGKLTETRLEMDVRADPEYREAQEAVLKAEEQATIFRLYSSAVLENVQALKKRIESFRRTEGGYARNS